MKRRLCLWAALILVCAGAVALGQEIDEGELLQTPPGVESQAPYGGPEQVYAVSDVEREESENPIDEGERPEFVTQLLEVARGELGYTEGKDDYSKYGEWAGDPNAAWCAEFICWCVDQTDQRYDVQLLGQIYPNYSGQNTGRDWLIQRGRFLYRKGNCPGWGYQWLKGADHLLQKNEYIPRSGDLMFFSYNEAGDTEHVALVEYSARDSEGNVIVHVIEGNNPSAVQRNRYRLDDSQVLGFGVCEDIVDTTLRAGNSGDKVRALQEKLCRLEMLEERHITGTYGGNTKAAVYRFQKEKMGRETPSGIADRETQQALEAEIQTRIFNDPDSWLVTE